MATKKELVQAQAFARRRLLTAFVSGAPGGKEREPAKPLRAVAMGIGLSVLLVVGTWAYSLFAPALPDGWQDQSFVLATDSGARYVSREGTLYPVANTTSARLLLPAGSFTVVKVSEKQIASAPRGPAIGIVGGPDVLPAPDRLVREGWSSCLAEDGHLVTSLDRDAGVSPSDAAALVRAAGVDYLVHGGHRYRVTTDDGDRYRDGVLRAVGLDGVRALEVPAAWLNLFDAGSDLRPLTMADAGRPVTLNTQPIVPAQVGTVIEVDGTSPPLRYVVDAGGELAPLSEVGFALYRLGSPGFARPVVVTSAQIAEVTTAAQPAEPQDWPQQLAPALGPDVGPCALLRHAGPDAQVVLARHAPFERESTVDEIQVAPGAGALVQAVSGHVAGFGPVKVIDQSGRVYAIVDPSEEVLAQLGYQVADVTAVPQAWTLLFPAGPELSRDAAAALVAGAGRDSGESQEREPAATSGASADGAVGAASAVGWEPAVGTASAAGWEPAAASCDPNTVHYLAAESAGLARLGAQDAWQLADGSGVRVAVVDSGVDAGNAHLSAILPGINLVPNVAGATGQQDDFGHGTAVAGVIGARPVTDSGVVGLAPGAEVLPVRVYVNTDQQSVNAHLDPDPSRTAAGIRYAVDQHAQVINVSLSTPRDEPVLRAAIEYAEAHGSLVVASAGNRETSTDKSDSPRYPAAYPTVLSVTATWVSDDRPTDAAIHGPHVDIAAPGDQVLTTFRAAGDCLMSTQSPSTSYATAYVSGAAALVAQRYPDESPAQWRYRLTVTASRLAPAARDDEVGWGVVQPLEALQFVDDGGALGPVPPAGASRVPHATADPSLAHMTVAQSPWPAVRGYLVWWTLGGLGAILLALVLSRLPSRDPRAP